MLKIPLLLLFFGMNTAFTILQYFQHSLESCHIGDVVQNGCNRCLCTSSSYYDCKPVDCIRNKELEKAVVKSEQYCTPHQMYKQNLITCVCNKDGAWPHKSCLQTFLSLSPKFIIRSSCKANTYVQVDCNICRCGPDGDYLPNRCTKNPCGNDTSRRADVNVDGKKSSVFSNCIHKNWYSLAPCQFCYCVNENRLVCNTANYYSKKQEVGKYNMEICGTDMLKEAMELIPEDLKQLRGANKDGFNKLTSPTEITTTQNPFEKNSYNVPNRYHREQSSNNDRANDRASNVDSDTSSSEEEHNTDSDENKNTIESPFDNIRVQRENLNESTDESDDADNNSKDGESKDNISNDDYINDIAVDINRAIADKNNAIDSYTRRSIITTMRSIDNQPTTKQSIEIQSKDLEFTDNTLKINVPSVLHKMFQMALRKSMVAISNAKKCEPGTTRMNKCNMCFCLKNGKELCTSNKCS